MADAIEAIELERRKRLDELFADEPFLSPTMKAKRLHEKLHSSPAAADHGSAPRTGRPGAPAVVAPAASADTGRAPTTEALMLSESADTQAAVGMSLSAAKAHLREMARNPGGKPEATPGEAARTALITTLRDRVLNSWLQEMPGYDARTEQV